MGPADPYTATSTTTTTSTTNGTNAPIPVAENSQSNNASGAPAPAKWLQPKNESEMETDKVGLVAHNRGYKLNSWAPSDAQFGGNKLRAPRTLARQEEYIQGNKKRTVVKRRRRNLDDDISDGAEDDPYRQINIEDILSPIEIPTDIVRRPALKRIIKSPQIEGLASTAMEFIESEKNFSKILSRLSAILHRDDPQYLDLVLERTPEQRKRRKTSQQQQPTTTTAASSSSEQDKAKDNESEQPLLQAKEEEMETTAEDFGPDTEAIEVVRSVRELLLQ
ncbi:hypothetical protein RO3G_05260 [Lichtheimia corymbifera JMRC:FSU:9682]|uniref:Transcriptional regulatory protein RXT2 N-terminal domain-containing protein n=1 Tax=Lichtheimia corymbifera JMRC:FSU:9682 TaxID=1263082 RepID=A0A068S2E8_9FUNG|nr:hypothetical protein RO3G_05260 [Lichtheimia corymbifera JMRC:FSU:9682]